MNVNLGIWDKLSRVIIFLLFLAGLLGVFVWYLPLIKQNERMRKEILRLDTQIQKEEERSKHLKVSMDAMRFDSRLGRQLRLSIDSVQNDPRTIERLAREKLGLARTNETVIRFEGPKR